MSEPEPQRGDTVQFGHQYLSIEGFSDDDGTRLNDGRWICASHLTYVGENTWLYTPKDPEEMTVAELVMEHRHSTRAVLKNHISTIMTTRVIPEITRQIEQATNEAIEYVMDNHYRTPPRLMGKDTNQ